MSPPPSRTVAAEPDPYASFWEELSYEEMQAVDPAALSLLVAPAPEDPPEDPRLVLGAAGVVVGIPIALIFLILGAR